MGESARKHNPLCQKHKICSQGHGLGMQEDADAVDIPSQLPTQQLFSALFSCLGQWGRSRNLNRHACAWCVAAVCYTLTHANVNVTLIVCVTVCVCVRVLRMCGISDCESSVYVCVGWASFGSSVAASARRSNAGRSNTAGRRQQRCCQSAFRRRGTDRNSAGRRLADPALG